MIEQEIQGLMDFGVVLRADEEEKLRDYAGLLERWSRKLNLVSPGDIPKLAMKHLLPSLAMLPMVKAVPHETILDDWPLFVN